MYGCTLKEDIVLSIKTTDIVSVKFNFKAKSDTYWDDTKGFYLIYTDTSQIVNRAPFASFPLSKSTKMSIASINKGFWLVMKEWSDDNSTVFESEPVFIKSQINDCDSLVIGDGATIDVQHRKFKCVLSLFSFVYTGACIDSSYKDDGVTGSNPDMYFIFNKMYKSNKADYIDQISIASVWDPTSFPVEQGKSYPLSLWDADFGTSPDDLIFDTSITIPQIFNITSDNIVTRTACVSGSAAASDWRSATYYLYLLLY